jgi:hypothetical protein
MSSLCEPNRGQCEIIRSRCQLLPSLLPRLITSNQHYALQATNGQRRAHAAIHIQQRAINQLIKVSLS